MVKAILFVGLVESILVAIGTTVNFLASGGKNPMRLFNFVASGFFGESASSGGPAMAAWGLVFHIFISIIWAALFFLVYPKFKSFHSNWLLSGIIYGVIIWFVMAFIVMPLSKAPPVPFKLSSAWIDVLIIITCAGFPVSFFAKNYYAKYSAKKLP